MDTKHTGSMKFKSGHTVFYGPKGMTVMDDDGDRRKVDTSRPVEINVRCFDVPVEGGFRTVAPAAEAFWIAEQGGMDVVVKVGNKTYIVIETTTA